jgi:hypothetical protein
LYEGKVVGGELVVASCNPTAVIDLVEEPLNRPRRQKAGAWLAEAQRNHLGATDALTALDQEIAGAEQRLSELCERLAR